MGSTIPTPPSPSWRCWPSIWHGKSFARRLLHRIDEPCGIADSYDDADSDLDPGPWMRALAECWNGPYPLVSMGMSLSNDWGGGGVIATRPTSTDT
jgi:hypothetical protein